MLSNDLNAIELKAPLFFSSMIAPLALMGIIGILVSRLGWPGIICLIVIIVLMPVQACIGQINGVGRAFQRALGNCTSIMAGFICFLFMHFTGSGSELTPAKIFSTMEFPDGKEAASK